MSRLPPVSDQHPDVAQVFAEIQSSRGFVSNALRSLAHSPQALLHFARLGAYIKYESALNERQRELVILCAAKDFDYEWEHHAPLGLQVGLTESELGDIKSGRVPSTLPTNEQALVGMAQQLFKPDGPDDQAFVALRAHWTDHQITDMVFSATYYRALGIMATAMDVQSDSPETLKLEQAWQQKSIAGQQSGEAL